MDRCDVAAGLIWHSFVALYGDCHTCERQTGGIPGSRDYGTHCHTGHFECGGSDEHYTEYRNYTALYQLWRNILAVSAGRNGACPVRKPVAE